ncbi:MAG: serine/threonine protein kinase [Planctomycetaceae bacterium]|nr:serine/threonine protein kinase [Planctomycetaceae bacterium]
MNQPANKPGHPVNTEVLAAVFCENCGSQLFLRQPTESCPQCRAMVHAPSHADTGIALAPAGSLSTVDWTPTKAADFTQMDGLIGRHVGVYHLQDFLGAGAMGRVYLARHADLKRSCALKLLPPQLADRDPDYIARFLEEGQSAAALVHPNIVTVHAIGEADGFYFLEMEFVPGQSLRSKIEEEGPMNPERATSIALKMAEGLAAAHREGFLHRDLKPDNVLLTHKGVPKIVDFGLAKSIALDDAFDFDTRLAGTPAYMPPELFAGSPPHPTGDIWALGVCYYELLTGEQPFEGKTLAELQKSMDIDPISRLREDFPDVPLEFAECLHLLLARSPQNRPADGFAASLLLQAVLGQTVDLETLLHEAFEHHKSVTWRRAGSRFLIDLQFSNGRRQRCIVERTDHAAADRLLCISSVCCEADPNYFETALRLNAEILHGGLAIREIDGKSVFVMLDNYPWSTVDPEEIRRSVLEVAHRADAVEKLLTGGRDVH